MKVSVKFFALHREAVGKEKITLDVKEGATIETLLNLLLEKYPALKKLKDYTFISLNHNYAAPEQKLKDNDEVALFPPVSGG
ncbi:MAG: MoaD/ThiS family protein [Candidatus Thermoplasmatota archaeon]|nr:MoaD/ThiS family protein [Candidatus Thermoplasmatota archaeon]